jgi:hypothetical protein
MATTNRDIKYINRDFTDFRQRLIEYSKTYFPNTYNDFSPASPGMMFMEQSAYIGDVLSFYLDNQFQETFTQYAQQINNLYELAYMFGYKPKISTAAQVTVDIYQQLPAKQVGTEYVPDYDYALILGENTSISSQNGKSFIIQDKIDFSIYINPIWVLCITNILPVWVLAGDYLAPYMDSPYFACSCYTCNKYVYPKPYNYIANSTCSLYSTYPYTCDYITNSACGLDACYSNSGGYTYITYFDL